MTDKRASEILYYQWQSFLEHNIDYGGISEAYKMAMKALEQQTSEDCISREEAIRVAEQGQIQGYEWQFKKLCNLPSVTPSYNSIKTELEPSDDCISRAKALEMLGDEPENWTDTEKEIQELNDYRWFKSILEELPPVTPKTDVLDKIKAEIDQKQYDFMEDKDYDEGIRFGLMLAYQIIDKYKAESDKESEE